MVNPAVVPPPLIRRLAIINFSGRYDMTRPVSENLARPRNIYFVDSLPAELNGPAKVIFRSRSPGIDQMLNRHRASVHELRNILGEPLRTVAVF
jgi:hypothetical protein